MPSRIPVVVEATPKRAFATALDWPGWCRGGRDEAGALDTLIAYGPRYARVAKRAKRPFIVPAEATGFQVTERLPGGAGTDFGAPGVQSERDDAPLGADRDALERLLVACWAEFAAIAHGARGRTLRKGPRGGGRELDEVARHTLESYTGYLKSLGAPAPTLAATDEPGLDAAVAVLLAATATALDAAERGELPRVGPRGGRRWPPRFFIRYSAWHVMDHAWEIEDRVE